MDPLSITVSVSSLIVVCTRVIRLSSELSDTYKSASFMLSAITAECSVISASLTRLQNMLLSQPNRTDALAESLETALFGCALTMSVLYDQIGGLVDETKEGEKRSKKFKFVLEHDHLIEMLQQIRGQQISISLMLQTIQSASLNEVKQSIQDYNAILQQMVKKGRSLWQASHQSTENPAQKAIVGTDETDSVFEISSIITDTRFDFDDQVLDSKAYRRALANLKRAQEPRNSDVGDSKELKQTTTNSDHEFDGVIEDHGPESTIGPVGTSTEVRKPTHQPPAAAEYLDLPLHRASSLSEEEIEQIKQMQSVQVIFTATAKTSAYAKGRSGEGGYPYLTYDVGEVFDIFRGKGALWLAINSEHPEYGIGWVEYKNFSSINEGPENSPLSLSSEVETALSPVTKLWDNTALTEQLDNIIPTEHPDSKISTDQSNDTGLTESLEKVSSSSNDTMQLTATSVARAEPPRWYRLKSALFGSSRSPTSLTHINMVVVGDPYCGKSSMLLRFTRGIMLHSGNGPDFTWYERDLEIDGKNIGLKFWDIRGDEHYDRLRPSSYRDSHVALICFSLTDLDTWENISERWAKQVSHFCPGMPVILVGCKKDAREDPERDPHAGAQWNTADDKPMSPEQGEQSRKELGATTYIECSAQTGEGIQEVFETATRAAMLAHLNGHRSSKWRDR